MTPAPTTDPGVPGSLRAAIEKRRAAGDRFSLREVVAVLVPLCADLVTRHARGETFFLHPGVIRFDNGPVTIDLAAAQKPPTGHHDRACMAPEQRQGKGGDARSSVFSIGAIAYEMLTGSVVGPGMRRPSELVANLPASVDTILSKALIGDPAHRPGDLAALAQAIHHLAPTASQAPPPADESALDGGDDLVVDVSLSMVPPPPPVAKATIPRPAPIPQDLLGGGGGLVDVAQAPQAPAPVDATAALADLKARLESDPRPRYVVIKDGMDHGPFSAIELLQQIASHTFEAQHILVDSFSNDERPIGEWEEFAPFAEHARLNREIKAEKQEIERVVVAESKATRSKAVIIGLSLAGVAALAGVIFFVTKPSRRTGEVVMDGQLAINIETDAGIKGASKSAGGGKWVGGGGPLPDGVARPQLRGGMSCEQAMDTYVTELKMSGNQPDLTAGAFGKVLNNGSYVIGCGAPDSMTINICAAVQNGRAVGVTVTTDPPDSRIANCIAGAVRGMGFPSHPNLDVTRTVFKGN